MKTLDPAREVRTRLAVRWEDGSPGAVVLHRPRTKPVTAREVDELLELLGAVIA